MTLYGPYKWKVTSSGGTPQTATSSQFYIDVQNAPTLATLTGTFSLPETADIGAVAGVLGGQTSGSTLALVSGQDAGGRVQLVGNEIRRGATALDYETAPDLGGGQKGWTSQVEETLAGATGSPKTTTLTLLVTDIPEAAFPSISPSAAWVAAGGTAGSGGTAPAVTANRTLTGTPTAMIREFFGDHVRFTNTHRVYFDAAALQVDKTFLNTMGITKVTVWYEGTTLDLTNFGFHTYTDVNGVTKTVEGWAVDLVHNGTHGTARLYATAHPRDTSKLARTIGPFTFYPAANASQGTLQIAATPGEQTGVRYKTIDGAANYAQQQGWQTWVANVIETADYAIDSTAAMYTNAGRMIIQGSVPFNLVGTGGTTYTGFGTLVTAYKPGISTTKPRYKRIELRGVNCRLDMKYLREFGYNGRAHDMFFNGCQVDDSRGRGGRWAMGPRQYLKVVSPYGLQYWQDTISDGMADVAKEANAITNCLFENGTNDLFTGTYHIYGNIVRTWGKDITAYRAAFRVYYTGAGTPTIDLVSPSTTTGAGRDIVLKANGVEISGGRYPIYHGDTNFLVNNAPRTANYMNSHIAAWIDAKADWVAIHDDSSVRSEYLARAPLNGDVREKPGAQGTTGIPISTSAGSPTQFYTYIDEHADFRAMQSTGGRTAENIIVMRNLVINGVGLQGGPYMGDSQGGRDVIFANNAYHHVGPYLNSPITQQRVGLSHVSFVHESYAGQWFTMGSGASVNASDLLACQALQQLNWTVAAAPAGVVDSNHAANPNNPANANQSNFTSGGTLFVDPANENFDPASGLTSNLKARRLATDLYGNTRAASDAAGAVAI